MNDPGPVIVRLRKSFSWQSTYHKYPFYIAEAEPDGEYTREQVYTVVFNTPTAPTSKKKYDWVRAVFGIEVDKSEREVMVDGIGLVEKVDHDRYGLSDEALELGHSYARDPGGTDWRITFAEILARFDVRTRVVLYYMGILGYALYFPDDPTPSGFGKLMSHAQLVARSEVVPFLDRVPEADLVPGGRTKIFNQLLDRYRLEVLGPFLAQKIESRGLDVSCGIEYRGGRNVVRTYPEPSTNDLSVYLKQSLSIFVDTGILSYDSARRAWVVNYRRAEQVFCPAITEDLFADHGYELFYEVLRKTYVALADQDGMVGVRLIRDRVCDELDVSSGKRIGYFNRQVARLLSEGRLAIGKTLGWHGSATDALFGDRSKEYVELLF